MAPLGSDFGVSCVDPCDVFGRAVELQVFILNVDRFDVLVDVESLESLREIGPEGPYGSGDGGATFVTISN